MKPLRLEIENLRSFRTKREIDFSNLSLCAIVGDTGAGKTSILEAITYALYNRSTWNGRNVKELIANGAPAMSVTFSFEVDGAEYTVTRLTRMRGTPSHRLTCPTRNLDVSGEEAVREGIVGGLHLTDETFLHTVLLPQGKHAELLTANKSDRNRMLGELFRLDEIGAVAELAKIQALQVEVVLETRRRDRGGPASDLEVTLAEAQAKVGAATKELRAAEAAAARVKALDEQIASHTQAITSLGGRIAQMADAPALVAKLRALDDVKRDLDTQAATAQAVLDGAHSMHEAAREQLQRLEERGVDRDSVNGFKVHLEACANEIRERGREQEYLQAAVASLPAMKMVLKEKQDAKAVAEGALANWRRAAAEAEARAEAERPKLAELQSAVEQLTRAQSAVNTATSTLERRSTNAKGLKAKLGEAIAVLGQAQSEADRARVDLEEATVVAGAAALAEHLHAGDDCPVCKRELPAGFVPPKDSDRDAAKRRDAQAREALKKASEHATTLQAQVEGANALVDEMEATLGKAETDLQQAVASVPQEAVGDPQRTLAEMKARLVSTEAAVQDLRRAQDTATIVGMDASNSETTASSEVAAIENRITALRISVSGREKACATKIEELPEAFRPPTHDDAGVGAARSNIDEALKVAAAAAISASAAAKAVTDGQTTINRVERERMERVMAPQMTTLELLDRIATGQSLPGRPKDAKKNAAWVDATDVALKRESASVRDALGTASRSKLQAEQSRAAEVGALGAEPSDAVTRAYVAKNNAERDVRDATTRIEQRQDLDAKIARIEPVYLGIKSLKDELGARRFQAYATEQRQEHLLAEASRILGDMTDGRYGFTRDFEIFDAFTNESRVAQALSGGEKFFTSLALSLAIVEIAANAGAKIGSLFLDEGFATLDSDWVETAMLELRRRARQGRSICVISHLSAVTQFVETTFRVDATVDGSSVTVIHGPMEEDSAAMEGLLSHLTTTG